MLVNVSNVKDYLTIRGIFVSGCNKIELVPWEYSATEMVPLIILSSVDLSKNLKEEYSKRLRGFNILIQK